MAISFIGQSGFSASTGNSTPSITFLPYQDGDLWILAVESANQPVTPPDGWTEIPNSPQSLGTSATASGVRLTVFYKWISGEESGPTILDTGDHTTSTISAFRGVDPTAPFNVSAGSVQSTDTDTIISPSVTTTVDGCLILLMSGINYDGLTLNNWDEPVNSNLSSLTRTMNQTTSGSRGGGLYIAHGYKTTAGETGTTTAFSSNRFSTYVNITLALAPEVTANSKDGSGSLSVGAQQSIISNKGMMWSLAINHGIQMSSSIKKGGQRGISLTHGIQMSATYIAIDPEIHSGTGTLSHGPQMAVTGQKSGRSPPHSDSLGHQMTLASVKGKNTTLSISHGQQVSGAGKKTGKSTGSQSLGIQSSLTGSKKASRSVSLTQGPQTTGTGKKTATGATAFSMGLQMEVTGEKPSAHSIELHHGINMTSTGKKSISSSLEVSHGAQIATASFKASNRLIETSLGVNVQTQGQGGKKSTGALTASNGDQVLGNGIKTGKRTVAVTLGDHESSTSHKGGTGESTLSHGIHLTVLSGAQIGGVIQIHHGAQMSAIGTKSSARVSVVEVGIKVSMTPKKGTKTAIGLTQGLEGSSYGYKQTKQAVVHSMGDRILTLWTRNSSGLVFSGGGVGIHHGAIKGAHGEEETSLGIVILIESATGEIYRVYDPHHVTLQEPESHILQIQPHAVEQTVGEASSVSVVKQEAHNRLTIREPGAIVITVHEKK